MNFALCKSGESHTKHKSAAKGHKHTKTFTMLDYNPHKVGVGSDQMVFVAPSG